MAKSANFTRSKSGTQINKLTSNLNDNYASLSDVVNTMNSAMDRVRAKYEPELRKLGFEIQKDTNKLLDLMNENPDSIPLSGKAKSTTVNNIKIGKKKSLDKVEFYKGWKEDTIIEALEKNVKEPETVVKTKKSILKNGLKALSAAIRKKCGIKLVEGKDEPFVTYVPDSDLAKIASNYSVSQADIDATNKGKRAIDL